MDISIIGTGYVGLVSGVCLAEKGHNVFCVDKDIGKVEQINAGKSPIFEAGLDKLLENNLGKRFRATSDLSSSILNSEITVLAVGTPFDGTSIDLSFIKQATLEIGEVLKNKNGFHIVVVKSTVTPGTTDDVVKKLLDDKLKYHKNLEYYVAMNPEFLREGNAISDFLEPDRVVCGANDERAMSALRKLYNVFEDVEIIETNCKTAEMIKYTSNSLLAALISFSNEIANLCSTIQDVDVLDVIKGVELDRRLSPILPDGQRISPGFLSYLYPGCGFGGSCFPKDIKALASFGKDNGISMAMLDSIISVNDKQPNQIIDLLEGYFINLAGVKISILGFAFKPGTDDIRESPSLPITSSLIEKKAKLTGFDPIAEKEAKSFFGNHGIIFKDSLLEAVSGADAIVIVTNWPEFEAIPLILSDLKETPFLVDGRRMLDKESVLNYSGIGIKPS